MRSNPAQTLDEYRQQAMRPRSSAKIRNHDERPFEYVPSGHPVAVLPGDSSLLAASTERRADLVACDYGRAYLAYVLASDAGEITEAERAALNRARLNVLSVVHSRLPGSDYAPGDAESYGRPAFDGPRHPALSDVQLAARRTGNGEYADQRAHDVAWMTAAERSELDRYGRRLTGEPDTY